MTLRIAMAQFDFPVGDVAGNAERIARMIVEARDAHGADIVLFPELALSGYPPEDLLLRPSFLRDCQTALDGIAANVQGIVAVVGWPQAAGAVVYNAASVLRDGGIEAAARLLADDAAAVWLYALPNIVITKPGITGVPQDAQSLSFDVTTIARA